MITTEAGPSRLASTAAAARLLGVCRLQQGACTLGSRPVIMLQITSPTGFLGRFGRRRGRTCLRRTEALLCTRRRTSLRATLTKGWRGSDDHHRAWAGLGQAAGLSAIGVDDGGGCRPATKRAWPSARCSFTGAAVADNVDQPVSVQVQEA